MTDNKRNDPYVAATELLSCFFFRDIEKSAHIYSLGSREHGETLVKHLTQLDTLCRRLIAAIRKDMGQDERH